MPMDERGHARLVREIDAKPLAGGEADPWTSVRSAKSEDTGRPAIHLQHACSGDQALRFGGGSAGHRRQQTGGKCGAEHGAAGNGLAHGRVACRMVVAGGSTGAVPAVALRWR